MATDSETAPIREGTALAHYVVRRQVGSGAMGTVYEAYDTALDRTVAIKVVNAELVGDPGTNERFAREARAAAKVSHPNLTHIYFVGAAGDRPWYAMEFVPGQNLEDRVAEMGPLSLGEAVDALVQAAKGLESAHRAGVIHRDVKPGNLVRLPDGHVKVTDFGLAKSLGGDPSATHAGTITGTPTYMSPEQCRGEAVDARTDVYSLGLTAWFLLTGRPAFRSPSLGTVLNEQMNVPLPTLAAERPDLPDAVDRCLARLCAKNPAVRPASMKEVVRLLEALRPRPVVPAPFAARAAALAVDVLAFSIVVGALAHVVTRLEGWMGVRPLLWVVQGTIVGALAIGSQWGLEVRRGASFGKLLFQLKVVREDGARASPRALAVRFLLRFPSAPAAFLPEGVPSLDRVQAIFGLLQLVAFAAGAVVSMRTRGRTLSDVVTHTRVVYAVDEPTRADPAAA